MEDLKPILRIILPSYDWSSLIESLAKTFSPGANVFCSVGTSLMKIFGVVVLLSLVNGSAQILPSSSCPMTLTTATVGRVLCTIKFLPRAKLIKPSSLNSFRAFLSFTFSSLLRENACAIPVVPIDRELVLMNSSISLLVWKEIWFFVFFQKNLAVSFSLFFFCGPFFWGSFFGPFVRICFSIN